MSAVEEVNLLCEDFDKSMPFIAEKIRAAIVELQAQRDICHASAADWQGQALLLQDELAALKGRRCETCKFCEVDERFCNILTDHVYPDFACNRWAEREKP